MTLDARALCVGRPRGVALGRPGRRTLGGRPIRRARARHAIHLRGIGHRLAKDYEAAIAAYQEALALWRTLDPESADVAIASTASPGPSGFRATPRPLSATTAKPCASRGRSTTAKGSPSTPATWPTGTRPGAVARGRTAGPRGAGAGRKDRTGGSSGMGLLYDRQSCAPAGPPADALPFARRAVEIMTKLHDRDLDRGAGGVGGVRGGVGGVVWIAKTRSHATVFGSLRRKAPRRHEARGPRRGTRHGGWLRVLRASAVGASWVFAAS